MIDSYRFIITKNQLLHNYVMLFFKRIEFETGPFDDSFFEDDFLPVVRRHRSILHDRFKKIYNFSKRLSQEIRSKLIEEILKSNEIEDICDGKIIPVYLDNSEKNKKGIRGLLKNLFDDLYNQVLNGDIFQQTFNTSLREHFEVFRKANSNVTLCPICGITELKTEFDDSRDQYDHYLARSKYPFSSVNFENLVLSCTDCNSLSNKADKDIVNYSTGKNFFPFNPTNEPTRVNFEIISDVPDIEKIEWKVIYSNRHGCGDKIKSWRDVYNIDRRYLGFLKGRIQKWYEHYYEYCNDPRISNLSDADKKSTYMLSLEKDEEIKLGFFRKSGLEAFLEDSPLGRAELEARLYN